MWRWTILMCQLWVQQKARVKLQLTRMVRPRRDPPPGNPSLHTLAAGKLSTHLRLLGDLPHSRLLSVKPPLKQALVRNSLLKKPPPNKPLLQKPPERKPPRREDPPPSRAPTKPSRVTSTSIYCSPRESSRLATTSSFPTTPKPVPSRAWSMYLSRTVFLAGRSIVRNSVSMGTRWKGRGRRSGVLDLRVWVLRRMQQISLPNFLHFPTPFFTFHSCFPSSPPFRPFLTFDSFHGISSHATSTNH